MPRRIQDERQDRHRLYARQQAPWQDLPRRDQRPLGPRRPAQSRHSEGFLRRYGVTRLVWFERRDRITDAIAREKQLEKWNRAWKVRLIEPMNPD